MKKKKGKKQKKQKQNNRSNKTAQSGKHQKTGRKRKLQISGIIKRGHKQAEMKEKVRNECLRRTRKTKFCTRNLIK